MTTLTYASNGGVGSPSITSAVYSQGATAIIGDSGTLVKTGYSFKYWCDSPDGVGVSYKVGDPLVLGSKDITLYAQWVPIILPLVSTKKGAQLTGAFTHTQKINVAYDPSEVIIGSGPVTISSGLVLLNTIAPDAVTGTFIVSTTDGSALPDFTVTLTNNVGSSLSSITSVVSSDVSIVSITYTPNTSVSYKFTGVAKVNFSTLGITKDIGLFAQVATSASNVTLGNVTTFDFGNVIQSSKSYLPLEIVGVVDTSKLSMKFISGDKNFLVDFGRPVPTIFNSVIFPIVFIPTSTAVVSCTMQVYYFDVPVGAPLSISGSCSTYVSPVVDTTIVSAPSTATNISVKFTNTNTSYLRIENIDFLNNSLNEFQLVNSEIALGHILKPLESIWFLVNYTPASTVFTYPKVSITGVIF